MTNNSPIMTDLQSSSVNKNIYRGLTRVDLNYRGYDSRKPSKNSLVLNEPDADVNRVLFWLSSKRDDYVRSYLKGGVLYDLLGTIASSPNLEYWKGEITRRFNEEFNGELVLLFIDLTINKGRRTLKLEMIVQNRYLGTTFPVNTEARL